MIMNKKFSTLAVGLLLAGGLFSTANAIDLRNAVDGQFYKLKRVYECAPGATGRWGTVAEHYLTKEGTAFVLTDPAQGEKSWWKIEKVNGKFQLRNFADGKVLKLNGTSKFELEYYAANDATPNGWLGSSRIADFNQFHVAWENAAKPVSVGQVATQTANGWEIAGFTYGVSTDAKGEAYDGVATSLVAVDPGLSESAMQAGAVVRIKSAAGETSLYDVTYDKVNRSYSFVDHISGRLLLIGNEKDFQITFTQFGAYMQIPSGGKYVKFDGTNFTLVNALEDATLLAFNTPGTVDLSAKDLTYYENGSFSVTIKGLKDKFSGAAVVDLEDNVFSGSLVPYVYNSTEEAFEIADPRPNSVDPYENVTKFYLRKSNGNFIVAKANLAEGYDVAYQLTEVSAGTLLRDIVKLSSNHEYFGQFMIDITEDVDKQDIKYINNICVYDWNDTRKGYVRRFDFRNVAYLAVQPCDVEDIRLYPISIKMGGDQVVDWKTFLQNGKYAVVKCLTTGAANKNLTLGVAATGAYGADEAWVKTAVNDLETQWALTINNIDINGQPTANSSYVLTNRENPAITWTLGKVAALYSTSTANQYRIGSETYSITFVAGESTDGYKTLDPIALKNQQYYVGVYSPVWKGTAWLSENHVKEHKIGLDSDKDNANLWMVTPNIAAREAKEDTDDRYRDFYYPTDSVYVISTLGYCKTWADGSKTYEQSNDTLKIASYSLQNVTYNEYIQEYMSDTEYYACNSTDFRTALRVALRKSGDYINLIPVNYNTYNYDGNADPKYRVYVSASNLNELHQNLAWTSSIYAKIYAGDSADKGLLNNTNIYAQTENDLFVLEAKEAPAYLKLNQGDVIRIYREGNESEQLFENGEFASLGNSAQLKDMNPALYVDTAWMNRNEAVNRYDYMLAVNVDRIVKAYECNVPDHKDLYHYVDTTYGRFLVNLVDSTVVNEDINDIHYSKYQYQNMPKLGFKYGFHTADKFFVPNAKDTTVYKVGDANRNIAKFAFQMVDDKNFVVETSVNNYPAHPDWNSVGYLTWINGNLVVSGWYGDAEVFSLTADDRTPTANEAVAAEVSVVAVKGAIIVKGAAGKVVTVANILGQTIANQVAASDNVTIAAPAGVAVVTVDGEATKVVVK